MKKDYINKKNTLILLFIIFHIVAIVYWNFYWNLSWDDNEDQRVYNFFRPYVQPFGLWQQWNIFAPPPNVEMHIIIYAKANGTFVANYTPNYQTTPTKINHERIRKWHESIIKDDYAGFMVPYLKFWCKRFEKQHNKKFDQVALYTYSRKISELGEKGVKATSAPVKKEEIEC